jgi:hypothetical protein
MTDEQRRLILTAIWFFGMLISSISVLSYMWVRNAAQVPLLGWVDVAEVLKSIFTVYGSYLGGMLVFWFLRPFNARPGGVLEKIRFTLALIGAIVVNAAYVGWLLIGYWGAGAQLDDIINARNFVLWLSFVVAPANAYFFGIRS